MGCCAICSCLCKLPGMLLAGCCPFAIGVYIGLILMLVACFILWSAMYFGMVLFQVTTLNINPGNSAVTDALYQVWMTGQKVTINGVSTEMDNSEEAAYCNDAYKLSGSYTWILFLTTFGACFLMFAGQLWWWKPFLIFSKIPCKTCVARLGLWVDMIGCIVILITYGADCGNDLREVRDAAMLTPGFQMSEYTAPGGLQLVYGIVLFPVSSLILTIFFAPKGQKLIPGFNAEEIGVEVEEMGEDGVMKKTVILNEDLQNDNDVAMQASCEKESASLESAESDDSTNAESKCKSVAQSEESVEMQMEPKA